MSIPMIPNYPAIDLHCHFNSGALGDVQPTKNHFRDLPFFQKTYQRLNILASVQTTYPSVMRSDGIYEENLRLQEMTRTTENLFQWAVLDPRQPALFLQVADLLKTDKVLGIKIHSDNHRYSILEYGDAIFSFANDHHATVVMHPDRIADMVAFADKYPHMRLIIAHLDDEEHVEAMMAAKHQNIYTDTSGGASVANNALEYAVEQVGADHIFFGTDSYAVPFQKGRILLSSISEEDKQKILLGNALRCFPKLDAWLNRQKKLPY